MSQFSTMLHVSLLSGRVFPIIVAVAEKLFIFLKID